MAKLKQENKGQRITQLNTVMVGIFIGEMYELYRKYIYREEGRDFGSTAERKVSMFV